MISYLILISGIALVLFGADRLTEGASSLAKRFKVSDMVIGLTVVASVHQCLSLWFLCCLD